VNIIFLVVIIASSVAFIIISPQSFVPAMLSAAGRAATLSAALLSSYCVWMGFSQVVEDCSLAKKLSVGLKPLCGALFKTKDEEARECISLNLSANLLGLGGMATPYGIRAAGLLGKGKNADYSQAMLFVCAATSFQLLPNTVLSLLSSNGAANPYGIILPCLLTGAFAAAMGILAVKIFVRGK